MTSGRASGLRYDTGIDTADESTHMKVVALVGRGQRVLELGCATGYVSEVLRGRGCRVVGIEVDSEAAKEAADVCDSVIVGDLDDLNLDEHLADERFDVVLAADVLEHLRRPEELLVRLKGFIDPGGYLVFSIPNVAHGSVRLALLNGSFRYRDTGLLDQGHLHFFTRETLYDLFQDAGYVVAHLERTLLGIGDAEVDFDISTLPPGVVEWLEQEPEALTYQFTGMAVPLAEDDSSAVSNVVRSLANDKDAADHQARHLLLERDLLVERLTATRAELDTAHADLAESRRMVELVQLEARDAAVRHAEELDLLNSLIEAEGTGLDTSVRVAELQEQLNHVYSTRLWRWGTAYWRLRDRILGRR